MKFIFALRKNRIETYLPTNFLLKQYINAIFDFHGETECVTKASSAVNSLN